jgi:hypothetical protein
LLPRENPNSKETKTNGLETRSANCFTRLQAPTGSPSSISCNPLFTLEHSWQLVTSAITHQNTYYVHCRVSSKFLCNGSQSQQINFPVRISIHPINTYFLREHQSLFPDDNVTTDKFRAEASPFETLTTSSKVPNTNVNHLYLLNQFQKLLIMPSLIWRI